MIMLHQGRQQKIFQGEPTEKRPKNSTIKPLSTIFEPCMKIQGATAPRCRSPCVVRLAGIQPTSQWPLDHSLQP